MYALVIRTREEYDAELVRVEQIGYEKGIATMQADRDALVAHVERLVKSTEELAKWMDELWVHMLCSRTQRKTLMQRLGSLFTT